MSHFSQIALNDALVTLLQDDAQRALFREQGLSMAKTADIYSLFDRAADFIVAEAEARQR